LPAGQNICSDCERLIVGVFVRIKDKNLHVDCFKCATCGTSLKNQGYFNLHNKLYCDVHARLAAMSSPPPNATANGLTPVTFPPPKNLGANTISSALNAHAGNMNGNAAPSFSAPKPFSYTPAAPFAPAAAAPPNAGPMSPSSYPPVQPTWTPSAAPAPVIAAPKPAPVSTGPSQVGSSPVKPGFGKNQGSAGAPGAVPKHGRTFTTTGPNRGQGILTQPGSGRIPICGSCSCQIRLVMVLKSCA
jgi:hypothetical protein